MITCSELFIKYGDRVLLDYLNFTILTKDKVGLVGRNGAGKSTILKLLAGESNSDSGTISRPATSTLGYLKQDMDLPAGKTVLEETLTAFKEVNEVDKKIKGLQQELAERTDYESSIYAKVITDLGDAEERFQLLGGMTMEVDTERVLKGLGFKHEDMNRGTDEFSGGWKMRIELAKMLLQRPDFLLLDEPTNHLDIESILWLEQFLKYYEGAVVVISHDKQFLDTVTKRTMEIELGKMYEYKATYSKYLELRAERKEKMAAAYKNQQAKIEHTEKLIEKFRAKATKAKMAQSLIKQLDKVDRIEMDAEDTQAMSIRFQPVPRSGEVVFEAKKLTKAYDGPSILEDINLKLLRGEQVSFVGQNGQGKTTLAKILVKELEHSNGDVKWGHNVVVGYYAQNQTDSLDLNKTLLQTMEDATPPEMRTKLRGMLGAFLFRGEDVDKKVSVLSGGEKARLALACMLLRPINFLILDEPTNHLDILSKEVLKKAVKAYDGTMVVVSHDRDFLSGLTDKTIEFRDRKLYSHLGDINFFLEKRAMDNMREVEMATKQKREEPEKKKLSEEDRKKKKKLQNQVSNAERKIEQAEKKIADIELEMGKSDFYQSPDSQKVMDKYQDLKNDLDKVMENWEKAQEELDAFEK